MHPPAIRALTVSAGATEALEGGLGGGPQRALGLGGAEEISLGNLPGREGQVSNVTFYAADTSSGREGQVSGQKRGSGLTSHIAVLRVRPDPKSVRPDPKSGFAHLGDSEPHAVGTHRLRRGAGGRPAVGLP